jgi:hypothetical protein
VFGNWETPAGKEGLARPHRAQLEEAGRLPRGKRPVSRYPFVLIKISKLSLQQLGAFVEEDKSEIFIQATKKKKTLSVVRRAFFIEFNLYI